MYFWAQSAQYTEVEKMAEMKSTREAVIKLGEGVYRRAYIVDDDERAENKKRLKQNSAAMDKRLADVDKQLASLHVGGNADESQLANMESFDLNALKEKV